MTKLATVIFSHVRANLYIWILANLYSTRKLKYRFVCRFDFEVWFFFFQTLAAQFHKMPGKRRHSICLPRKRCSRRKKSPMPSVAPSYQASHDDSPMPSVAPSYQASHDDSPMPSVAPSYQASHDDSPMPLVLESLEPSSQAPYVTTHVNGTVQKCSFSTVLAMEILHSCTRPAIYFSASMWCHAVDECMFRRRNNALWEDTYASHQPGCYCHPCLSAQYLLLCYDVKLMTLSVWVVADGGI